MNTRIKNMEMQCWEHSPAWFNSEKFAELIVRECSEIAARLVPQHANKDEAFYWGYTCAAERIARDIKDCFEVDKFVPLPPGEIERLFGNADQQTMKKAVCVLVNTGPGYLAVTRPNSDLVGLVGGKVEPGETELEAIVREVQEEVGLALDPALFKEVFAEVCYGEVDYFTTTFTYPDLPLETVLAIKPEAGLEAVLVPKTVLCNKAYSPFAEYNTKLFESIDFGVQQWPQ